MIWEVLRWFTVSFGVMALVGLIIETRCYWQSVYCPKEKWNLATLYVVTTTLLTFGIVSMVDSRPEKIISVVAFVILLSICVRNTIEYPKWTLVTVRPAGSEDQLDFSHERADAKVDLIEEQGPVRKPGC